ncbi:MAG: hypothetical protein K0Q49_122 [Haloplasmataceae bacterium]|nr:hypothetical protein [Haloplasmataceae bacterium]
MNRNEFLNSLKSQLIKIPESERADILYDYNEHFTIGIKEGRKESEIAASLGNPSVIAKEINANHMINKAEQSYNLTNTFSALLAIFGLGFLNLVFVLGPFMGIVGTLFALLVSGIAIAISGIALIIAPFLANIIPNLENYLSIHPAVLITSGIGLIAFGILWIIGFSYLIKLFYQLTIKYLKLNLNIILNRRNQND